MRRAAAAAAVAALVLAAPAAPADAPAAEVQMADKAFGPPTLSVLAGTTVTWRNLDGVTHTVTADDDSFDSGFLGAGASFTLTFRKPGTYKYACRVHRFMKGELRVFALVLAGPEQTVRAGGKAVLTGLVPGGRRPVVLERRWAPGRWHALAHVRSRPDGSFAFVIRPRTPAVLRARAGATASPLVRLHVAPKVAVDRSGSSLRVATDPPRPRAPVALQAYARERFGFVTRSRARLGADGRATVAVPAGGRQHVRVVVRGSGGWSDGVSPTLVVRGGA